MRILICHPGPDFSVADMYYGWADALRELGNECLLYNLGTNDRLIFYSKVLLPATDGNGNELKDELGLPIVKQAIEEQSDAITMSMQGLTHAAYTFWPDVVLFVSGFFVTSGIMQLMRARRHKVVLLHSESPYQDGEQLTRAPHADLNLLNDPVNIAAYEELGPALYMPHAYRPDVHYPRRGPVNPELAADLTFIGTCFRSRAEFFERMDFGGLDVLLGGSYWDEELAPDSELRKYVGHDRSECVGNTETAELYRHAKMGINLYRRESEDAYAGQGWAMGPREVEMARCHLPFARDSRPEGDEVLSMLPRFTDPEDASEILHYYVTHDREREVMADKAFAAIEDRTFLNNARRLLRKLDTL